MTLDILFIGDPHFQINNMVEIELFMTSIVNIVTTRKPDLIVIAGDILHTHERLHTTVLNKAHEFVNLMRRLTKTYILVGNHDYISNTQFLNDNHWMNSMKEWDNVVIVDRVLREKIGDSTFVFVPYVYPGRFEEALDTLGDRLWSESDCIFAHQEFEGCKMGAIVSIDGDNWNVDHPQVISGHIHNKQQPQSNIFYPGTPMQHAFGDTDGNVVVMFKFKGGGEMYDMDEIKLDLPRKTIVYLDIEGLEDYTPSVENGDKLRITVTGSFEQFKTMKKTAKYKNLINDGVKIVFKPERDKEPVSELFDISSGDSDFLSILSTIVMNQKSTYLLQAHDLIIRNKITDVDDIFFL